MKDPDREVHILIMKTPAWEVHVITMKGPAWSVRVSTMKDPAWERTCLHNEEPYLGCRENEGSCLKQHSLNEDIWELVYSIGLILYKTYPPFLLSLTRSHSVGIHPTLRLSDSLHSTSERHRL